MHHHSRPSALDVSVYFADAPTCVNFMSEGLPDASGDPPDAFRCSSSALVRITFRITLITRLRKQLFLEHYVNGSPRRYVTMSSAASSRLRFEPACSSPWLWPDTNATSSSAWPRLRSSPLTKHMLRKAKFWSCLVPKSVKQASHEGVCLEARQSHADYVISPPPPLRKMPASVM